MDTVAYINKIIAERLPNDFADDKPYRDALESVALAMYHRGITEDDIRDVIITALDAYENNG